MKDASLKVSYWALPMPGEKMVELDGIETFTKSVSENYIAVVQGKRGDCGGGLYELTVEFVTSISLIDVAKFIASGVAYDLIKAGTESFILRPFLNAYKKLKDENPEHDVDIYELKIAFRDCLLVVRKITDDSVFDQLEGILQTFSKHYANFLLRSGNPPYEIHIPVFEDVADNRICRFRTLLDVDETIRDISPEDYFKYWGMIYNDENAMRIYDLNNKFLIDETFLTQEQYWAEWDRHNRH